MSLDEKLGPLLDELLAGWDQFTADDGPKLAAWRNRTVDQVTTTLALAAHVHETVRLLRPVLPDRLTVAHMPLVRAIFESTITLVWCDEVADGARALMNETTRQRLALRDDLAATRSMAQFAELMRDIDVDKLASSSEAQARYINQRCREVALDGAYPIYRILSGLSHATIEVVDAYVHPETTVTAPALVTRGMPFEQSTSWAYIVTCCLVWSGMVANYLDQARTRRNDLRRIARALNIDPELDVRYSAVERGRLPKPRPTRSG